MMKLYTYWRSSSSYRVRIALNLKQIEHELVPVNLLKREHQQSWYQQKNPTNVLPTLELYDGTCLCQSLVIIDYLEHIQPKPALIPKDLTLRAKVLSVAYDIAMEVQPINNLGVLNYLKKEHGLTQEMTQQWMNYWMSKTFAILEAKVSPQNLFCFGDEPTLADVCLIPQLYNAERWKVDLSSYPRLKQIQNNALQLQAFQQAQPQQQPDAD